MPIDAPRYRQIIGHFATGVTVVTTARAGLLHGMTANAVASVSLDPLLMLVCVDKSAHMHAEVGAAQRFAVNILTDDQEDISRTFAATTEPEEEKLQGVSYHIGEHGCPLIEGALAYLECEVTQAVDAGDHTVFIASVLSGDVADDGAPLLFYRGGYRGLER
jgi:flavin reductase (DIM6/NTAB) family NADH-FMN oxidoreductase RutF